MYEWKTGNVPTVIERPVMEEAPPDVVTEEMVRFLPINLISVINAIATRFNVILFTSED